MAKLILIFIVIIVAAQVQPQPFNIKETFNKWTQKLKDFFKSPATMIRMKTVSGLICNITKLDDFNIEKINENLVIDIPVAILLKTINYISCQIAKTGEKVEKSAVEFELIEHKGQAIKMRLLNPCDDGNTKEFEADTYVDINSSDPDGIQWDNSQKIDCPNNSKQRYVPSFLTIFLFAISSLVIYK
ncbi:hypothetical protein CHUAL_014163 [Chamberlinius hualienensis]